MKIAFIDVTATVSYGGIQVAIWQLARELSGLGHQVTVFGGVGEIRPDLGGRPVEIQIFPFTHRDNVLDFGNRFRRLWERWSFARAARGAVLAGHFDWIILTKPFDFFWPRLLGSGCRARFIFMSGGTSFFRGDRYLARNIEVWLACSHFNAWQIGARFKHFPKVIYNGVDVAHFRTISPDVKRRAQIGVAPDDVLFAFAGRLVGWKGVAIAVRALAEPALKNLPVRLLIIGDGGEKAELMELSARLGVAARVIFQGAVPHRELPNWYGLSDVGIFPSIADEAFGITIAEAMACGLPVIGSHIGGIPEVIGNEESAGLLVAAADPPALAVAMARLTSDAAMRVEMGRAARQRIAEKFTWELAAQRLLAALPP